MALLCSVLKSVVLVATNGCLPAKILTGNQATPDVRLLDYISPDVPVPSAQSDGPVPSVQPAVPVPAIQPDDLVSAVQSDVPVPIGQSNVPGVRCSACCSSASTC